MPDQVAAPALAHRGRQREDLFTAVPAPWCRRARSDVNAHLNGSTLTALYTFRWSCLGVASRLTTALALMASWCGPDTVEHEEKGRSAASVKLTTDNVRGLTAQEPREHRLCDSVLSRPGITVYPSGKKTVMPIRLTQRHTTSCRSWVRADPSARGGSGTPPSACGAG